MLSAQICRAATPIAAPIRARISTHDLSAKSCGWTVQPQRNGSSGPRIAVARLTRGLGAPSSLPFSRRRLLDGLTGAPFIPRRGGARRFHSAAEGVYGPVPVMKIVDSNERTWLRALAVAVWRAVVLPARPGLAAMMSTAKLVGRDALRKFVAEKMRGTLSIRRRLSALASWPGTSATTSTDTA